MTSDRAQAAVATRTALALVRLSAIVAWSIVPGLSGQVLGLFDDVRSIPAWPLRPAEYLLGDAHAGAEIKVVAPLMTRIVNADVGRLEARFSGRSG